MSTIGGKIADYASARYISDSEIKHRTVDQSRQFEIMNALLKVLLVVVVVGICNSLPQNAPPGRPYRDTSSQSSPPAAGAFDGPQVEDLRSTKDIPKEPVRESRQTKDIPKDHVSPQTKDIPKLTEHSRVARQSSEQSTRLPETRPVLPGSAGQPQVQPIRSDRVSRQTKDIPKHQAEQDSLTRETRQSQDDARHKRQVAQPIPQPLPQPTRQTRQTKDIPKHTVASDTKDIPKDDTRHKRQVAQPIPQPLPGSPQPQPPRQTRQTKDIPKEDTRPKRQTKDIPKDSHATTKDIPKH